MLNELTVPIFESEPHLTRNQIFDIYKILNYHAIFVYKIIVLYFFNHFPSFNACNDPSLDPKWCLQAISFSWNDPKWPKVDISGKGVIVSLPGQNKFGNRGCPIDPNDDPNDEQWRFGVKPCDTVSVADIIAVSKRHRFKFFSRSSFGQGDWDLAGFDSKYSKT